MKILYVAPRECFPLNTGALLRDYHLARELAAQTELTYVALRNPVEPPPPSPPATSGFAAYVPLTRNRTYTPMKLIRGLLGPLPITILNYYSAAAAKELSGILKQDCFDTVQVESVHSMGYIPGIKRLDRRRPVLADWHNIESEIMRRFSETTPSLPQRLFASRTATLLEAAENELLTLCDAHTVASAREKQKLEARVPSAEIHVVPNGVAVAEHDEVYQARTRRDGSPPGERRRQILFVGSMDYHANIDAAVWFVQRVWPELCHLLSDLSFTIVGRKPAPEVKALAAEKIRVTGTVEDIRPFYRGAALVIVPIRVGSGTRLKILEAMAAGVPVVSTRLGAEGLEVADGENILLADTPREIITAVQSALQPDSAGKLVRSARELVTRVYDWRVLGEQLRRIHGEALQRARRAPGCTGQ